MPGRFPPRWKCGTGALRPCPAEASTFDFQVPGSPGYERALVQARRIHAARRELLELQRGPFVEITDLEAFGADVDREVARLRALRADTAAS